jgi:raffinose/stachyose/melibiose transport system substrate-binding protein
MKRKFLAIALVGAMAVSLAANGGSGSPADGISADSAATTGEGGSSSDSLHLVNGKIEVDAPLKALAAAYEAETGVHVEIESIGGGVDIQGQLKQYFQGNNMPDIFVNGGATDFANWEGLLADMSNEAWVEDTEAEYVDVDGKVVGFPYTTEAIGLAYNADILEKAGIDPASITGPESMKAAFETLDSKKDELGLTAVIGYCAEAMNLYWSTGDHLFDVYEDEGLERDDTTYFDLLTDGGKIDKERFVKYAEMVGLFNQYSDPSLLVSGTYDQQILNFASGKYAFVTQGSWIGVTMTTNDKEQYEAAGSFKVGMLPYAFEEGQDTILTNSPSWWAVFDGTNADAAKAFLQWCSEDAGQKILVEDAGFISPFKSCKYTSVDPFAQTITDYMQAGKTSAWHFLGNKEGLAQNALGVVYQDYASGNIKDAETFTDIVSQATAQYYAS